MTALLRKYPSTSYFVLAFALSWGAVYAVIAPGEIPAVPDRAEQLFPIVYLAMLVGPSVAGILMTGVISGAEGLRAYRRRLLRWRVSWSWYVIVLLTAPVVLSATLAVLSSFSVEFTPAILSGSTAVVGSATPSSPGSFALFGVAVGVGAGIFEELGWTGFAVPTMRSRLSVLRTGLILGLLWGAWHFLAVFWGSASAFGPVPIPVFMTVSLFAFLPPYRVLMVRMYDRTESLLLSVLMHASLTASMIVLGPVVAGYAAVAYNLAFGAALWVVVGLSAAWGSRPV
jgi:membrane protease YdiL (CAAX protease family)